MAVSGLQEVLFDEVGDDLSVGFGSELVAFLDQFLFERKIVLDDAVVDDDNATRAVPVRVGVLFGRTAVGGPPRVPDAISAIEGLVADDLFEVAELAFGAADLKTFAVAGDGYTGRVIASIFQASEAVNDDRDNLFLADVTDDAAHAGEAPKEKS
jgi:hypothetical protein